MMAIGPSWRRVIPLLGLVPALALAGCGDGYDVAERRAPVGQAATADETCRFEQSRQILPVSRASWLTSLDTVTPKHWPAGMYSDFRKHQELKRARGSRAPKWPTRRSDRFRFEPYRAPARAFVVQPDDHTLFVMSLLTMRNTMRREGGGSGSFHTIAVLDVDGGMREHVLVRNTEGGQPGAPLEMQVATVGSDVVVAYATVESICMAVGRPAGDGFEFTKPRVVLVPQVAALDLCLAPTAERLHLVWTQPGDTPDERALHYASAAGPDSEWSAPIVITPTARPGTVNFLADGEEIFVAWIDSRFVGAATGQAPLGSIMAAASRDDGVTFSRPIMITDPTDPGDTAAQLLLTTNGQNLVVYSSREPWPAWPTSWNRAMLERSLKVVTPEGEIAGEDLLAAFSDRMTVVFGGRPASGPGSRTASAD
ncbi:MAG: hypothetical protein ACYTGF_09450 [Planctomycetota bacterium]|jgi:hypothetical protein